MKSLVDISLLRLRVGGLRWLLLILLGTAVPLHGQDGLARQAVELMQAGRFHEAEILWRQLQVRSPNYPAIHNNLGVTLAQARAFEAAAAEYRKSLSLSPKAKI
jgi:Flp pilus assembly protein TadD